VARQRAGRIRSCVTPIRSDSQMASAMRLELIQVPVSDIDRAKAFYVDKLGFAAEASRQELAARGVEVSDVQVFP